MALPVDKIDGDPEGMQSMNTRGLKPVNPTLPLDTFMEEGIAFTEKDKVACKLLDSFVRDADLGVRAYSNQARAHGLDYLSTDAGAAAKLKTVTTGIYA